jgi:hypothetical protein
VEENKKKTSLLTNAAAAAESIDQTKDQNQQSNRTTGLELLQHPNSLVVMIA